ncbi:MAG: threonine synthase [Gemmatimonadota bacterium]
MNRWTFRCGECGTSYAEAEVRLTCPACSALQEAGGATRGVLDVEWFELPGAWPAGPATGPEFLSAFLPIASTASLPPLPVGGTPLLPAPELRRELGLPHLWVKDDTRNPSGSTKDRASLLVAAKAREYRIETVAAASTGNAATALAAVAASCGLRAVVFVPASAPRAKLVQMMSYGAEVLAVDGTYDDAFELCREACDAFGWYNRNTALNPFTIEGKKTAALEIAADLAPESPDVVLVPTGDGVIAAGVAKGFAEAARAGLLSGAPRLVVVQPEGSAAISTALRTGADAVSPLPGARSVADSLVVEIPRNAIGCLRRVRESGGTGVVVPDEAILAAIPTLASATGVFPEPAAAAALAGLETALDEGIVDRDERVVLLVTGTGLKDVPAAARALPPIEPVPPDLEAVRERLAAGGL